MRCLRERKVELLKRTKKTMIRAFLIGSETNRSKELKRINANIGYYYTY